ncbi:MAG: N-acetylmuramoyl-L-alanine amidase [Planctomycetes bacterium]|nr:N-acetylmuramoyl-L-alanine amidase [Planctomycetota bacterium]
MSTLALSLLFFTGIADLDELARRHDFQWSCEAATGCHTLRCGSATIVFAPGFYSALVNGSPLPLSMPATVEGGRVKLPPELARFVESSPLKRPAPVIAKETAPKPPSAPPAKEEPRSRLLAGVKIAIDPGHGGMHTGGKGLTGLMEKDINLGVSLNLQRILESLGARVVMTRTQDGHFDSHVDEDLDARVDIVNAAKPDLFLSIHTNYVATPGPRGFEVWVPRCGGVRNQRSRDLADLLRGELGNVWGANQDRGIKDDHNLRVLKGTSCPAALVELEFISNPAVERQLGQPSRQRELAAAIAEAVKDWAGKHLR